MGPAKKRRYRRIVDIAKLQHIATTMAFLFNAGVWQGLKVYSLIKIAAYWIVFSRILW